MDTEKKCREVMQANSWTQRELSEKLGISETSLSSARKGRRPLPAHAFAALERLRGVPDSQIVDAVIRAAACVAVVSVSLLLTPSPAEAAPVLDMTTGTMCIM